MDPVAFQIGSLTIRWYGVFTALGFAAAFSLMLLRAPRHNIPRERVSDLTFTAMIGGLLGARLLYVLQNLGYFTRNPGEIIRIDHGGQVFYGGFILAVIAIAILAKLKKMQPASIADMFAPALPLGHAFGRVGCFLNGCCFGKPYNGACSVHYHMPEYHSALSVQHDLGIVPPEAMQSLPVFPIQLVASIANLAICIFLLAIAPRIKARGQLFALYAILYSVMRFSLEFMRGDYLSHPLGLTPAQWVGLIVFPIATAAFFILSHRSLKTKSE
jgi:phosphatidylglycerol---prolipoprotein diacylglyceryl transferase